MVETTFEYLSVVAILFPFHSFTFTLVFIKLGELEPFYGHLVPLVVNTWLYLVQMNLNLMLDDPQLSMKSPRKFSFVLT